VNPTEAGARAVELSPSNRKMANKTRGRAAARIPHLRTGLTVSSPCALPHD
jgi:hypothetical protein